MAEINVQTTLPEPLYELLARLARREKRPLKAVVRDAIERYVRKEAPLEDDPILRFIGSGRLKEGNWSERKDWRA